MKKLLALLLLPSCLNASPYFRVIDPAHPEPIAGASLNPRDLKDSRVISLMPLLTHSPKDGCLFPSIVCEDWTPIAVGASFNAGKVTLDIAPLTNVLPWFQNGVKILLPDSWVVTKSVLSPNPDAPVTFAAGPMWEYRQSSNKGYFMVVTALALHF